MRLVCAVLVSGILLTSASAQQASEAPADEKARKSYERAVEDLKERNPQIALDGFKKADKQSGGHCLGCEKQMIRYGVELGAEEMIANSQGDTAVALAHYQSAMVFYREASQRHKDELFTRSHDECTKALTVPVKFPEAVYLDGQALAHLKQDDAATAQFAKFLKIAATDDPARRRAERYIERPELARARMAPAFSVTTLDGQTISMDDLQGKVVLLDFWATWCPPCREAVPHLRDVAKKFQGEPLVILSVSLDSDMEKWQDFITKNQMTWLQYRDSGFAGAIAKKFGVDAIPHTFTIDSDGVLQDEHIGDAAIEGKLRKLIARAKQNQPAAVATK
ncbi:MAG TPA: TlpA disulfide reductase family protein [Candidatus Saccharimonadales bacterium]|nr:TlpA disulfide reductase family protein [Candidatus Saccharimonadales bacterium]